MALQNLTLDRSHFNKDLYSRINDLWFDGAPDNISEAGPSTFKKWFGMGTQEERAAFDAACSAQAAAALDTISPQRLKLPPFESLEADEKSADLLSLPFLQEVKQAQETSEKGGADTLLALVLLLDQMPRNLFREQATLPLVYNHYDRLSIALLRSSMQLSPSPLDYSGYALRQAIRMWYTMPLIHSEQLSAHHLWYKLTQETEAKQKEAGDVKDAFIFENGYKSEGKHIDPIRRFGRYPHRNECLGRKNTPEEEEYLENAETFGVKQQKQKQDVQKDEL